MQLIYIIFFNNHTFCFYSLFVCLLIIPFIHHNNQLFFCILLWSNVNIQKQYNYHPTFTFFFLISLFWLLNLTMLFTFKVCLHNIWSIIILVINTLYILKSLLWLRKSVLEFIREQWNAVSPNKVLAQQHMWLLFR